MAARIKFVKKADAEILRSYLDEAGIALVFPGTQTKAKKAGLKPGDMVDYDFGGEADVFVEIVSDPNHYILQDKRQQL